MKVINFPQKYKFKSPTIILGGFEVLHIGHEKLIKKAKQDGGDILMMIVDDVSLLPKSKGSTITSLDVRLQQMANIGINGAILLDVKKSKFLEMSGDKFINLMVKSYGIKNIVCGKDFRYGKLAKSSSEDLKKHFLKTTIVDLKKHNNIKISSSIIKELVYYGNIEAANELLVVD
jgi:riboflavin kinase/FMN adenylyltransferase